MDDVLKKLIAAALEDVDYHMSGLSGGQLSVNDWQESLARSLLVHHYASYMSASGQTTIPDADRKRLNSLIGDQVDRLNLFADDLEGRDVTDRDVARANLYCGALKASYSIGATKDVVLPAHPADGSTPCYGGCGCSWQKRDDGYYWVLGDADHCTECKERAASWAPYREG